LLQQRRKKRPLGLDNRGRAEKPNIERTEAALEGIVVAGNCAGDIVASVRTMFKKEAPQNMSTDINQIVRLVLSMRGEPNVSISLRVWRHKRTFARHSNECTPRENLQKGEQVFARHAALLRLAISLEAPQVRRSSNTRRNSLRGTCAPLVVQRTLFLPLGGDLAHWTRQLGPGWLWLFFLLIDTSRTWLSQVSHTLLSYVRPMSRSQARRMSPSQMIKQRGRPGRDGRCSSLLLEFV
jgi:hypothetical protein